jgi:hypothetical protein
MKAIPVVMILALVVGGFAILRRNTIPASPPPASRPQRSSPRELSFWKSAIIAEPPAFRPPTAVSQPPAATTSFDHRHRVAELLTAGNLPALNLAVSEWFAADPAAARDWISVQPSLDSLQTAIVLISGRIAQDGDPALALEWADQVTAPGERDQVLFDIYASAARSGQFSRDQLRAAPLPPERLERLLSGAADD